MVRRSRQGALTAHEKKIVKALLSKGWRNQDIQALVNTGRSATINSARITGVKQDARQRAASVDEVEFFIKKKESYDPRSGLNLYDDERLIRAREAMTLAVQIFNSPALKFKTEVFSVLANIAWTYLLHEFYERKGTPIVGDDGRSLLLSQMVEKQDSPLTSGMKQNLRALKIIRDEVEHKLLGRADAKWQGLFQACCLNFDKVLCELYGDQLSLSHDLSFALQFSRMNLEQLATVNRYEIPAGIDALDARLVDGLTEEQVADLEYQFRVIYTMDAASKSRSHIEFVRPESAEGKEIRNVLVQYKAADHLYPHKPSHVVELVAERSGVRFTSHNHTQAWLLHNVRPRGSAAQPENTNKDYCIFHATHNDYTYSEKWVERLVEEVQDATKFAAIKAQKI